MSARDAFPSNPRDLAAMACCYLLTAALAVEALRPDLVLRLFGVIQ